jgi:hypothetical protein
MTRPPREAIRARPTSAQGAADGNRASPSGRRTAARSRTSGAARGPSQSLDDDLTTALPRVLKIFSTVVAPTTLLTALLLYFGRMHATGLFRYLGVQYSVLDLTTQDYLVRSADGMIPPLVVVAGATVVALWIREVLIRTVPQDSRRRIDLILSPLLAVTGLVLVALAIADTVRNGEVFPRFPEARGLGLSIGALLLAFAARLVRSLLPTPRSPGTAAMMAEWAAVFALVSVGLFWAVGAYAVGVGETRGRQLGAAPPDLYAVTLYSDKSLSLAAPGVTETPCQNPDAAYRFRYDGLRMVVQSGGQYLLLPSGWSPQTGAALLIPRASGVRLEFGGDGRPGTTC